MKAKFEGLEAELSAELNFCTKQMEGAQTELRYLQKKTVALEESLGALQTKYSKLREDALGKVYGLNTRAPAFRDNTDLMLNMLGKNALK